MFKRFVLAPDSFKGTLEAAEVCEILAAAIRAEVPDAQIAAIPMTDGGEGMTAAYLRLVGGTRVELDVTGPLGAPVRGFYGMLDDGSAVIEMAVAAGLPLAGDVRDPLRATTWGVGELIRHAAAQGARRILLGLGGSATNDMGAGMAAALGWRFLDEDGAELAPLAENLNKVARILPPDEQRVSGMLEEMLGVPLQNVPGSGAAGGMGAGVLAFLGGTLKPGIEMLLDAVDFDAQLKTADVVFTGEGCMDWQSANGKVPMGVGMRCKRAGVPCIALCGSLGEGAEGMYGCGVTACFSAIRGETDFSRIRETCRDDLDRLTRSVVRLMNAAQG